MPALSPIAIRMALRDADPVANELLDAYEFSDEEIDLATNFAICKWNETPPDVGTYTVADFPWPYHLYLGVAGQLLYMAGHSYRRNQLQVKIAGGAVDDRNKEPQYKAAADSMTQQFNDWMAANKRAINHNMCWGDA